MKKIFLIFLFLILTAFPLKAQVYSNVLVEVNLLSEMTALIVSAPFVWCRENNTLYYYDPVLLSFTPYPSGGSGVTSVNGFTGVVVLTKSDIALGNVDNTSDATKNAASVTLTNKTLTSPVINTPTGIVKGDVGLGNVDNTSDATKNAASVTLTNKTLTTPVINSPTGIVKGDVGLGNVDNTSDTTKNAASVTLTNKTINGANNTVSNLAQSTVTNLTTDLAARVLLTQPYGYTVDVQGLTSSPVDAQTIFFGNVPRAPTTTAAISQVFIRKAGTIKVAEIYVYSGTAGTNENWSINIRKNNTTDTLIATVGAATNVRVFSNTGLSVAVAAGDYIEIKSVNPTWATNPLTTVFAGYIYIE